MAAGALFAAYALAVAATAVLVVVTVRLVASGDARFEPGVPARVLLAAGFAAADAALLVLATKRWAALRPLTVALAVVVSVAWPLSGIPLPAAALAVLAVGLAAARDRARPSGSRVDERTVAIGLSIAAAVLLIAGAAVATTHPARETTPAAKSDAAAGSRDAGPSDAAGRSRAKPSDAAA
ncbi:MAG TPA: hypothetical protein VFG79_03995, partial [Solirubrobacter sp.]|nr:hypothetical protein [Solirubrobacter sp.]